MDTLLPFLMDKSDPLSQWRAETFWTKEVETLAWLGFFSEFRGRSITSLVDVGSNVGLYSLYWLSLNPDVKVIACEPFKENMNLLKNNLKLNLMLDRANLVSAPLYSESLPGSLIVSDLRPGSSGSQFKAKNGDKNILGGPIDSTTLDEILIENIEDKLLKIDVDGLDFEVLRGAKHSLASGRITSVLIEASEKTQLNISHFLEEFSFISDQRFNEIESHSDFRRIAAGNDERNRVYSLRNSF